MPDTPDTTPGVSRLHDIVVEEVSLVDRAANKRRFLIVKRSDTDMEDNAPEANVPPAEPTSALDADAPPVGATESAPAPLDPLLATALTALEGLTTTVELLGALGGKPDARLIPLAEELKATAEELMSHAGIQPTAPSTPPSVPHAPAPPQPAPEPVDAFTQHMADARAALAQLASLTAKKADPPQPPAPPAPAADPVSAPAQPSALDGISAALTTLTESFQSLAASVQAQQQRLAVVEKNVGLPQSASPEHAAPPEPEDTAWPLDLNHPMDRDSVEKTVSFHDL